jgi:hypothetical protein
MGYSGTRGKLIHEYNLKSKISCQTLFKVVLFGPENFSSMGDGKRSPPGTGRLFRHGVIKKVSFQEPKDFSGIGER